ncbi:MAG TPA: exonuclease domain-containing protein [Solirubrobacteraceae bacterium]|nr:exonuclease domain-containing protein [Solirubrobacteraceae bacterium]
MSVLLRSEGLRSAPLATAEFLAVDTETNGLARERCELTEVGAVLVGGGELHERWSSLVGVSAPLSPGIQRFTGISQAMVDAAPPPEAVLPELGRLMRGRVLVAHSARFDLGVLRAAFARAALDWPEPPVLCTVAMARRLAPLQRRRGLAALADALGIDVDQTHRALPDAETCARVFCALFARLTAHASTIGEAVALLGPRRGASGRRSRAGARRRPPLERPDLSSLPRDPGVYVFRDSSGNPLYVGKSVCLRTRARAHFTTPAEWTGEAEHVDYQATESELGALLLEDRLIKALRPPGNVRGKRGADGYVYLRCRLDIAFPILEVALEPAGGHSVTVGPVRGRAAAAELVEQLNSLFGLRHCGRRLPRRYHPSAYGQMGRCLSPCLGDLDPNLYRERLDAALRLFVDRRDGGAALLAHIDAQRRAAVAAQNYERAGSLQRRRARLEALLHRLGGVLRAAHTATRLMLAPHPAAGGRFDAFWIAGGRVVDWGALPADATELAERSAAALRRAPRPELGGWLPVDEISETRLVGAWVAAHEPPALELDARALEGGGVARWVRSVAAAAFSG